jgi:hypothetical protein
MTILYARHEMGGGRKRLRSHPGRWSASTYPGRLVWLARAGGRLGTQEPRAGWRPLVERFARAWVRRVGAVVADRKDWEVGGSLPGRIAASGIGEGERERRERRRGGVPRVAIARLLDPWAGLLFGYQRSSARPPPEVRRFLGSLFARARSGGERCALRCLFFLSAAGNGRW